MIKCGYEERQPIAQIAHKENEAVCLHCKVKECKWRDGGKDEETF